MYIGDVLRGGVQGMVRTQIYLTEPEQQALQALAQRTGRTRSELIREAVDRLIAESSSEDRLTLLRKGRGLWQDRESAPDIRALRAEFEGRIPDQD